MTTRIRAWLRDVETIDLITILGWFSLAVIGVVGHDGFGRIELFAFLGLTWCYVADLKLQKRRCPLHHGSLGSHSAIVTASVEPSADVRQGAHAVAEMRAGLIASGYTPEQASRQVADIIAAQNRGQS